MGAKGAVQGGFDAWGGRAGGGGVHGARERLVRPSPARGEGGRPERPSPAWGGKDVRGRGGGKPKTVPRKKGSTFNSPLAVCAGTFRNLPAHFTR